MTEALYRLRKWRLTSFVAGVSTVALFTRHISGDNWEAISISLLLAYGLDKWAEMKKNG